MRIFTLFIALLISISGFSQVEKIAANVDNRDQGKNMVSTIRLVYKDKNGKLIKERKIKSWRQWENNKSEKLLLKFMAPAEIKNSAFLSVKTDGKSVQKLYLPSFGKVRTIGESSENSSFMGSDFNYSDLKSRSISNDALKILGQTDTYWKIECILNGKNKYKRRVYLINKNTWLVENIKFYKADVEFPEREMKVDQTEMAGNIVIAKKVSMTSYKSGTKQIKSSSEMIMDNYSLNTEIKPEVFTGQNLQKEEF